MSSISEWAVKRRERRQGTTGSYPGCSFHVCVTDKVIISFSALAVQMATMATATAAAKPPSAATTSPPPAGAATPPPVAASRSDDDGEDIECLLWTCKECYVYQIPPLKNESGHRANDWDVNKWLWSGALKVTATGTLLKIILYDPATGALFATCPVAAHGNKAVDQVIDSSRYFVLRLDDGKGRHAFIGMGFRDRSYAYDFNATMQDHWDGVRRGKDADEQAKLMAERAASEPMRDLSLKEGEKLNISINVSGSGSKPRAARPKVEGAAFSLPGKPGMLAPPPKAGVLAPPPKAGAPPPSYAAGPPRPPTPPNTAPAEGAAPPAAAAPVLVPAPPPPPRPPTPPGDDDFGDFSAASGSAAEKGCDDDFGDFHSVPPKASSSTSVPPKSSSAPSSTSAAPPSSAAPDKSSQKEDTEDTGGYFSKAVAFLTG